MTKSPDIVPKKALNPFLVSPATRNIINAERSIRVNTVIIKIFSPFLSDGIRYSQIIIMLPTKERRDLIPTFLAYMIRRATNIKASPAILSILKRDNTFPFKLPSFSKTAISTLSFSI